MSLKEIVDRRLKILNLGPIEAATQGGLERTFIRDIVEGKKRRVLDYTKLADALGLDAEAISRGQYREKGLEATTNSDLRTIRVAAHVQAGYWAENWEWPYDEQYDVAVPADPALAQFQLFAAETRGPSMNRRWPEGTVVVFTNVIETEESPVAGKRYVVERRRANGDVEHTVKLLHQDRDGRFWLIPESNDPVYQEPIPVDVEVDGGEFEVRIVGRVRYAVTRE